MLDRTDAHVILDQGARQAGVAHIFAARGNLHRFRQIGASEDDTGIDRRRPQRHVHLVARMQSDAGRADRVFQCALLDHSCKPMAQLPKVAAC